MTLTFPINIIGGDLKVSWEKYLKERTAHKVTSMTTTLITIVVTVIIMVVPSLRPHMQEEGMELAPMVEQQIEARRHQLAFQVRLTGNPAPWA